MKRALAIVLLTLCGCEQPAAVVALGDGPAGNPTVAVRGDTALVAWVGMQDSAATVLLARVLDDSVLAVTRVNDLRGDAAPHDQAPPQVRVAPDGTVYVAWQNNTVIPGRRFPSSNLRLARSTDGGRSFESAIFVNDDANGLPASHTFHDIAVAPDGAVYVSWIDGRERARAEQARPDTGHVMHDPSMPGSEVRVAKSVDGGRTFGPGVVVHPDVCPCCRTSLVAGDGVLYVAFRSAENNVRDIMVSRSNDGGATFAAPARVHADGWEIDGCPHAGPSLALIADGTLHVSWYTAAPGRTGVWYAHSRDGAAFDAPVPVLVQEGLPVTQTKLAVDARQRLWLSWDDRRTTEYTVHTAVVSDGRLRPVRGAAGSGYSPAAAAGAAAAVVWQTEAGPQLRMLH